MRIRGTRQFRYVTGWAAIWIGLLCMTFGHWAHADSGEIRTACSSLASLSAPDFKVEAADWVGATRLTIGAAGSAVEVPDHCLFRVTLDPRRSDLENMSYGIGIELRLPAH